jgi:serine/threonine-protein kinase
VRLIGQGAFGRVYEAEHAELGRRCAIKLLHGGADSARSRQRFAREARLLARLEHENIVGLSDAGEDDVHGQYLVLEFIRGTTLRDAMVSFSGAPARSVLGIVRQLSRGLGHAHAAGIVHRDLKPENVMLAEHADGTPLVKILDFGVARLCDGNEATITSTGAALGTAAYMAPEQARGDRDVDQRVDVYALGVIVYEALSGTRPFDGTSYNETLFQILTKPHVALHALRRDLPAEVCAVVERALSKERTQRFDGVEDFARAFSEALCDGSPGDPASSLETQEMSGETRALSLAEPSPVKGGSVAASRRSLRIAVAAGILPSLAIGWILGTATRQTPSSDASPKPELKQERARSAPLTAASGIGLQPMLPARVELPAAKPPASATASVALASPDPSSANRRATPSAPERALHRRSAKVPAPATPSARRDRGF